MADDITLTVRVRDMTRGDFNQIRQRMRGMDGDVRRLASTTDGAAGSADRFSRSIRGVEGRLGQLQQRGNLARHEMDYMRRSMGLLGRDLRQAAQWGELTGDEFRELSQQLQRTRLDFDHLDNEIRRHDAVAQRAHREEVARIREAERLRREAEREAARRARDEARRVREGARRERERARAVVAAAALRAREERRAENEAYRIQMAAIQRQRQLAERARREELRGQMAQTQRIVAQQRRVSRAHAAALREEAQRNRRAEAERNRAARAAASSQRQSVGRLAGMGDADQGLTLRFRALGEDDVRRMARGFDDLQRTVAGVSGSTARARRNVRALSGDLQTMSQALRGAQDSGSLSRREFNALSNGLRMTVRDMRLLQRSGDMSRSSFRAMRREVAGLRAQLLLLGDGGTRVQRLDARLLLLQRRMRDAREGSGLLRRSMSRVGEGLVGGLRGGMLATAGLIAGMKRLASHLKISKRWTMILVAALLLIGPAAQALGALLVAALGGAFIALGALALKNSTLVKRAFQEMKASVSSSVREAAKPMEEHLVAGIHQVGVAVKQMQPLLAAAFTATGPLIKDFVGAFTDLAGMSMPGIITALQDMGPAMEGFRTGMGLIGQGFGDMFAAMTASGGAEALRDVWITLGHELANLLVGIGEFINFASKSDTTTMLLVGALRSLSGILNTVQLGLALFDTLLLGIPQHINESVVGISGLTRGVEGMGTSFVESGQSVGDLKKKLKDVNKEIKEIKTNQKFADDNFGSNKGLKLGYLENFDSTNKDLLAAQTERESILSAITAAEGSAADATARHAASITDLIAKVTALNETNRSNLDARSNMERVIDEATKGSKEYSNALKMVKGDLDLDSESAQKAYGWLSQLASATKESTDAAIKANDPWDKVRSQWKRGYDQVVSLADGMGLTKEQARTLADQIVGIPDKEIFLQARTEQAKADLDSVIAAMQAAPNEKTITVKTLTADSITTLEKLGFTIEQLPDGSFTVTAKTGTAVENIGKVKGARDALKGKNITMSAKDASSGVIQAIKDLIATLQDRTITVTTRRVTVFESFTNPGNTSDSLADALRRQADNARGGATGGMAGQLKGFAEGGSMSGDVLEGPGTKKSDSILARLSRGEFVMRASAVDKYGPSFMKMVNEGRLKLPGFAKGGSVRSEARQAIKPIKAATSGTTEKNLLRLMSQIIKGSIKMATALKSVTSALDKAKNKLSSLRSEASSLSKGVKSAATTNITEGVDQDKAVTMSALMTRMTRGRDKATAFAGALKRLRKRGLSKGLLRQIAEAGVDGGGLETAGALLRSSGSEMKSINSLYGQMAGAASSAGKTTADALYGKQIKIQEKLVKSLDELAKALKKATSKKRKATGGIIGAASGGLRGGLVEVGEQGPELVRLPFGSSVYSNADSRRIAGRGGGGGGGIFNITVMVGEKKIDEIVLDSNRRTVRTRGGNVQAVFGASRRTA